MQKFIFKLLVFFLLNVSILAIVLWEHDRRLDFQIFETESFFLKNPIDQQVDFVLMGTSHASVLTWKANHELLERALNGRVFNLAKSSNGILPQKILLTCFMERSNRTAHVLYFLDPFILFSRSLNEDSQFAADEPIRWMLIREMYRQGMGARAFLTYFYSKLSKQWFQIQPWEKKKDQTMIKGTLPNTDPTHWYPEGLSTANFDRYAAMMRELMVYCQKENIELTFIIPPTLIPHLPGQDRVLAHLRLCQTDFPIHIHDFSQSMKNSLYFRDMDHLNTDGVDFFAKRFLKPALGIKRRSPITALSADRVQ